MNGAKVITMELIVFVVTVRAIYGLMVRGRDGISPQVLANGYEQLHPQYRKKVDRSVGGWLRRFRVSVEALVRRYTRLQVGKSAD